MSSAVTFPETYPAPADVIPLPATRARGNADRASDQLRALLPRQLATGFRPHANPLARAIVAGIRQSVHEYRHALDGAVGEMISASTQAVILGWIDNVVEPSAPRQNWRALFRSLGAAECGAGRPLAAMQEAYRIGGKVAAHYVATYVRRNGASIDMQRCAAAAVTAQFDELAAIATEGYGCAREAPGGTERARQALANQILGDPASDDRRICSAARAANWVIPDSITVVALARVPGREDPLPTSLGNTVLIARTDDDPCLIAPSHDPSLDDLADVAPGWRAAIGPPVPLCDARGSLRIARRALDLAGRGLIPAQAVIDCADHPTTLTLFADDLLIDTLIEHRLMPLAGLTERQQERMVVTLHEWLATRGHANEVAARLKVHPQTVRYRLHRIEELFGDQLADPQTRFELALAVRAKLLIDMRTDSTK